jgi:inhibitor of cysteine peptidase
MAELRLGFLENNKTVAAKAGDTIVITLPENATTGFQWDVVSAPQEIVQFEGRGATPPAVGAIGAGGSEASFRFKTHAAGSGDIILNLSRGDQSSTSASQYTLTLNVSQ